jgi:hypothetical protein
MKSPRIVVALIGLIPAALFAFPHGAASQDTQIVENLRAFAKLYGYVKYFHPSDAAAETDWDAFAVYGADRIVRLSAGADLASVLEELFLPIAPTVQVYAAGEVPAPMIESNTDTSGLMLVAWQHVGLGIGTTSRVYQSIRLNRENRVAAQSAGPAIIMQSVDATSYRGKQVRLNGYVRTRVSGGGNQAQLWLRVDRVDRQRGFFDNMADRPIKGQRWEQYEIVGEVADDATRIVFGCFLVGDGSAWIDDVQVSVRDSGGTWEPVEIANAGFEEVNESGGPAGWSTSGGGAQYVVETDDPSEGARNLAIKKEVEWFAGQLFEDRPDIGEAIEVDIGAGLMARVPLALLADSSRMVVRPSDEALAKLWHELAAVSDAQRTADEISVRLAGVIVTWNVFQHFYPYFDLIDTDWDYELKRTLEEALADEAAVDFYFTMNRLVAMLHDGHGRVIHPDLSNAWRLPVRLEWVEDRAVVTASADTVTLRRGDIIVSVDGKSAEEALLDREQYISGSPQWQRYRSLMELGASLDSAPANLAIDRNGAARQVEVARSRGLQLSEFSRPNVTEIVEGIYYVNLDLAEIAEIDEQMEEIAEAKGVVFDLRGYPNGNHAVISNLLEQPDTSGSWMQVAEIIYPDQQDIIGWKPFGWRLPT